MQDYEPSSAPLRFTGHHLFRHRLVLALLSFKAVRFDQLHADDDEPGLKDCEVSFLRLLEKLTNGSKVEISYTGTSVLFVPGTIIGGPITHTCPNSRAIGWYLEPILAVAPFCKKDLQLTLKGVTTNCNDISVDALRISGLPTLAMWLAEESGKVELRITKRGHPPGGGGECTFRCPSVKALKPGVDFTETGKISKIRGIAHSVRVSPQIANRMVVAARAILNPFIPDVYIYTDVYRGEDSGKSPGFALTLLASSTTTALHHSESSSSEPLPGQIPLTPEDIGIEAAQLLLQQVMRGGCIDFGFEWLAVLLLLLSAEVDVGRVKLGGPIQADFIQWLRDLHDALGTMVKIVSVPRLGISDDTRTLSDEYVVSAVGIGYSNRAKPVK